MKKIILIILCLALFAIPAAGCVSVNVPGLGGIGAGAGVTGRGSLEKFTFNVGDITELRVTLLCNVEFYTTQSDTVTFEVQSNLMDYITVEERNGVLTVRSARNINWTHGSTPTLTIGAPNLSNVIITGAGMFTAHDTITVDSFNIEFAGASTGKADFNVDRLSVNLAGAGSFTMTGFADKADFTLAGAGRIDALDLQTRIADVNLAGAGTVRVGCTDALSVIAAGVGTVEYRGTPTVDITRGGLVTVRQVN